MRIMTKKLICVILSLLTMLTFLCSCGASPRIMWLSRQGKLPDPEDFPNTKWVCREMDMTLYMLEGVNRAVGELKIGGKTYRVTAQTLYGMFNISIKSTTTVSESDLRFEECDDTLVNCTEFVAGYIDTTYLYENGVITCTVEIQGGDLNINPPPKLHFDKVGTINQQPEARWYAQELDMYIEFFTDTSGIYFKGEMMHKGKMEKIYGYEKGNNNFYRFTLHQSPTRLVDLYFEYKDGVLIAHVEDDATKPPLHSWENKVGTITFRQAQPE